jgi:protein-arginine kinase activator protein McsA
MALTSGDYEAQANRLRSQMTRTADELCRAVAASGGSQAQQRRCARCHLTFARILRVTCRHCNARVSRASRDQTARVHGRGTNPC